MSIYKKVHHDNVRRYIRSETLYTPDQLAHEISLIAYSILDTLTDHNNDQIMNQILEIIFGLKHRLNGGDYDVIKEEGDLVED